MRKYLQTLSTFMIHSIIRLSLYLLIPIVYYKCPTNIYTTFELNLLPKERNIVKITEVMIMLKMLKGKVQAGFNSIVIKRAIKYKQKQ